MSQREDSGFTTMIADGDVAIPLYARVANTAGKATLAGAADKDVGTNYSAEVFGTGAATDEVQVAIKARTAGGTHKAIADGAITAGVEIATAASGKVSAMLGVGAFLLGTAMEAAAADGDIIEIMYGAHGDTAGV